jgi:hypothetical protein
MPSMPDSIKELDAAQDAFDREMFADAEQGFAQLTHQLS